MLVIFWLGLGSVIGMLVMWVYVLRLVDWVMLKVEFD